MLFSISVLASISVAVTAARLKVNYYTDGGCTAYRASIYPGSSYSCYNYQISGTNSANIADCTFPNGVCACTFWTGADCTGAKQFVSYPDDDCASNWGAGFQSMSCGIIHDP